MLTAAIGSHGAQGGAARPVWPGTAVVRVEDAGLAGRDQRMLGEELSAARRHDAHPAVGGTSSTSWPMALVGTK